MLFRSKAVIRGALVAENIHEIRGKTFFAFAGIGRPDKFFSFLRALGAKVSGELAFADHHPYQPDDFHTLQRLAQTSSPEPAALVTTDKDAIRIPHGALPGLVILHVALSFDAPDQLTALIRQKISRE